MYPTSEIFMMANSELAGLKELTPYVHHFIEDQSTIENLNFDKVIDLKQLENNGNTPSLAFGRVSECASLHTTDALLEVLPKNARRRRVVLKESIKGFEEMKQFAKKPSAHVDVVIYPFSVGNSKSTEAPWSLNDFYLFISYFFSMNPGKRVLLAGLESQREELEGFLADKRFPEDLLKVGFFSVCGLHSVLKRTSFVVMGDTPLKHLVTNPETTLIEMAFNESEFEKRVCYRTGSYILNFKKKFRNRFIYRSDELAFDNSAHFAAYIMTSIFDEDEEKLRWFAEKYVDNVDISKTRIDSEMGLQLVPSFWGKNNIAKSLIETSQRLELLNLKGPRFSEEFYNCVFDESDISQDQIMYDLCGVQRELEKLIPVFKLENHFATAMKIENRFESTLEGSILKALLDQGPAIMDEKPSRVSEYITEKLVQNLFFIRQVMNVSGQKLLENLPMTVSYYS